MPAAADPPHVQRFASGGRRGDDLYLTVALSFADAVRGVTLHLEVNRFSPCATCGGSGCAECRRGVRPVNESVAVTIPAGVDTGAEVRVPGEGHAGPFGGPRGDLVVTTRVREHPFFVRKGDNLHCEVPITLGEAILGARIQVAEVPPVPAPTTIHWHGVRVPIEMDGVPDISQPPVATGETFTYDFVVRDAGLYWYHPHVMSAAQVGYGLYGPLLVEDPADGVGVEDQVTLVLSDIGFDSKGVLEPADSGGSAGMVFGREGDYVLVNGRHRPVLRARAGAPQRPQNRSVGCNGAAHEGH